MRTVSELILRLERLQGKKQFCAREKRNCVRLLYPPQKRPILKVKNHDVEVVDISEVGLRIFNYLQHDLGQTIQGKVLFPSGVNYSLNGTVVWQFNNEIGVLSKRIPMLIIEEEAEHLLRYFQQQQNKQY